MKKTKITALLLSLVMLYSAAVPGTWATDEEQVTVLSDEIIGGDGVVVEEIPEDTSISEDEPADSVVVEDEPETDAPETETPDAEEDASGEETEIEKCEYCDVALTPDAVHDEWCMTNFETEESSEGERLGASGDNVHNVTQNKWYSTLSAATEAAAANNVIEVHNSFTETISVKIQKNGLTIRAAAGKNPTISWTNTDPVSVTGATSYHCVVIYTSVTDSTTFGGGTGTLTFDASKASDTDNKGTRARVMMHCGSGALNIIDGIVITGGNPGGGSYDDKRVDTPFPSWSGEIVGQVGFGAGIYMYNGTLNMSGGIIKDNYSLWGATAADRKTDHNYVGGGGGVYLHNGVMNMTGGTITHNAAGSGGGAGILVGHGAKLNVSGGTISENVVNFASGGGIGVRTNSEVKITGGSIINNHVTGHGGGLFARGDSIPLEITGGTIEGNTAGSYGGGVLFWTVGDDVTKNTVIIGGDVIIKNNSASRGGGVSVGREVLDGKPIGNKAKLIINGNPVISGNTAQTYGGGIDMQSDEFSAAVNTVEISGGTISENKAKDGGGIYVPGGTVTMTAGTFNNNTASGRGAGIFTGGGTMTISNASFIKNIAQQEGGGAFVQGGQVIMNGGTFAENVASNGGALYINNGDFTMTNGIIGGAEETDANTAVNGGAIYVSGGNVTIEHGTISNNKAIGNNTDLQNTTNNTGRGGAVYLAGDDDTKLVMESGSMNGNTATNDGGAIFATSGLIKIGLEYCQTENDTALNSCTHHTEKGEGRHHPIINYNTAGDTGGGIAIADKGVVHFYCGTAKDNGALYKGVGKNVFMDGGEFHMYDGADVGVPRDPDLVIIGGKLHNECVKKDYVNLYYYQDNKQTTTQMAGLAEYEEIMNLPDGEYFWDAPEGYVFLGWTAKGTASGIADNEVRNKEQYVASGEPVEILDAESSGTDQTAKNTNRLFDGTTDAGEDGRIMHLYALWAPITSTITYMDGMTGTVIDNHTPDEYTFNRESHIIDITPIPKAGYDLVGWYIYQEEDQNANWNEKLNDVTYEPKYSGGKLDYSNMEYIKLGHRNETLKLEAGNTNFGDIVLIAMYEAAFTSLRITKMGVSDEDTDQTFLFRIIGEPSNDEMNSVDMTVVITGNDSVTINELPVGNYTVREMTDWSGRYEVVSDKTGGLIGSDPAVKKVEALNPIVNYFVLFENERKETHWLDGNHSVKNIFNALKDIVNTNAG